MFLTLCQVSTCASFFERLRMKPEFKGSILPIEAGEIANFLTNALRMPAGDSLRRYFRDIRGLFCP